MLIFTVEGRSQVNWCHSNHLLGETYMETHLETTITLVSEQGGPPHRCQQVTHTPSGGPPPGMGEAAQRRSLRACKWQCHSVHRRSRSGMQQEHQLDRTYHQQYCSEHSRLW